MLLQQSQHLLLGGKAEAAPSAKIGEAKVTQVHRIAEPLQLGDLGQGAFFDHLGKSEPSIANAVAYLAESRHDRDLEERDLGLQATGADRQLAASMPIDSRLGSNENGRENPDSPAADKEPKPRQGPQRRQRNSQLIHPHQLLRISSR